MMDVEQQASAEDIGEPGKRERARARERHRETERVTETEREPRADLFYDLVWMM